MSNANLITMRCRRCLGEITHVEPGALVSCAMGCRLLTRATLAFQPRTRIVCRLTAAGFFINFFPGLGFDELLAEFKAAIPQRGRGQTPAGLLVADYMQERLFVWLDSVVAYADVVREEMRGPDRLAS